MSHNPLAVALEMHMKSAKERNAEIATLRSHLETATAENERLRAEAVELERVRANLHVVSDRKQEQLGAAKAALETARKALEAANAQFEIIARDNDNDPYCDGCGTAKFCALAAIDGIAAALRAIDTPAAAPEEGACEVCEGDRFVHDDDDAEDANAEKPCPACGPSRSSK